MRRKRRRFRSRPPANTRTSWRSSSSPVPSLVVSGVRVYLIFALAILIQETRDQRAADASIALSIFAKRYARKIFGVCRCVHVISNVVKR